MYLSVCVCVCVVCTKSSNLTVLYDTVGSTSGLTQKPRGQSTLKLWARYVGYSLSPQTINDAVRIVEDTILMVVCWFYFAFYFYWTWDFTGLIFHNACSPTLICTHSNTDHTHTYVDVTLIWQKVFRFMKHAAKHTCLVVIYCPASEFGDWQAILWSVRPSGAAAQRGVKQKRSEHNTWHNMMYCNHPQHIAEGLLFCTLVCCFACLISW